uniref:Uncharacterized protein n=1 Tax=viral metagenome TaxID=1070528 RepID=A0A6M3XWM1_9ZZZZ
MTDETEGATQTDDGKRKDRDLMLQLIVSFAEKNAGSAITLFVNGTVISGTTVSQKAFLENWVSTISDGFEAETVEALREAFGLDEDAEESDRDVADRNWIHLRDAQVFTPGGPPMPANGLLWRGKIHEVNGFSFGRFSQSDEPLC